MTNHGINSSLSIRQAIAVNKALLRVSPPLERVETFRLALLALLARVNLGETEEFHKNLVIEFFRQTFKGETDKATPYFINTKNYAKGEGDLVIHTGKTADSAVGVILEFKKPQGNLSEMPKPHQLNVKAFQQLLFYFLQERLAGNNLEVKKLVITNIYEWFIFDAQDFERLFVESLGKKFEDFTAGRLTSKKTDYFYQEIAKPVIAEVESQLKFVYFDLRDHQANLETVTDEMALVDLFKIFSPEYLLKLPSVNDSNRLDEGFYNELLHIIGLTVVKVKGKKFIERQAEKDRHRGSLLENAIAQLQSLDKLSRLSHPLSYGETAEGQLFGVALALVIVWINRILFLKLLEAQLLSYHKQEKATYRFLNSEKMQNYGDLQQLFFEVLAVPVDTRDRSLLAEFARIPYLNSSLFEPTNLEQEMIFISNLREESLPLFKGTILRDEQEKAKTGEMKALAYLFAFLDAYDFGSEETGVIKKNQKRLISSSVLGLIFERINGYKDGSFFTPAFITMYMCRETIRRAVIQKFNEVKGWHCESLTDLYNEIRDKNEANQIINCLKICDPAVGSGHFLVSALNEMIAIKSELGILMDREGKLLRDYGIEVVNDELSITYGEGDVTVFFEYNPGSKESQRVQETLFHEKQTIIENCLFGVDINENSVQICRLRLWIELLKNAYYRTDNQLETLPNIDINIKRGNSLISRFALDSDLGPALRKNDLDVVTYRNAVQMYRNAENKQQKQEMVRLIERIKGNFKTTLFGTDPNKVKLRQLEAELYNLENQTVLFEESKAEKKAREKKITKLQNEVDQLRVAIEEVESGRLYENALEWRFEFPEVLNDQGDFVGFDVIIGNPPYGAINNSSHKHYILKNYLYNDYQTDLYATFFELSEKILKQSAELCLIVPNTWLLNLKMPNIRKLLFSKFIIHNIRLYQSKVFEEAIVDTSIVAARKEVLKNFTLFGVEIVNKNHHLVRNTFNQQDTCQNYQESINLYESEFARKIKNKFISLKTLDSIANITQGTKPFQLGKGSPPQTKSIVEAKPFVKEYKLDNTFRPLLRGSLINKYSILWSENYYISFGNWLAEPRYSANYDAPKKVIIRQTGSALIAALDIQQFIVRDNLYVITSKDSYYPEELILAFLNSKLLSWYYQNIINNEVGEALAQVKKGHLAILPIPEGNDNLNAKIINFINKIIDAKKANPNADTTALEAEIDRLVYQLYGLTDEEIAIIENSP